jgi:hypothetical protein
MSNASVIEALEVRVSDMERKANALIEVINDLRKEDGLPPRQPGGGAGAGLSGATHGNGTGKLASIKSDTFFGKKMQTAIREYLNMRRASNGDGPAAPREIYDAITAGGYQFEAKEEHTALVGLRALMRKRTAFFIKMPNGKYGLTEWYPDARKPRVNAAMGPEEEDDNDEDDETIVVDAAGVASKGAAA